MDIPALYASVRPRYPELGGKVALITGSGRGIGQGIAIRLAREGMKIVIHGLKSDEVEQTTYALHDLGVTVIGVTSDLATVEGIEHLIKQTVDRFATIDLLVNNAAILHRVPMPQVDLALLESHLNVNIRAPYLCAQMAVETMREVGGSIVNISSVGGSRAHWQGLPYDMTKGALDAMTRAMSLELAVHRIRVNAVAPGAILTHHTKVDTQEISDRIPLKRFGSPLEIGNAVAFLSSEDAQYITGQIFYVDGGISAQLSPPGQPI